MIVIVARWLCSALQLGLTLSGQQPEAQKTLILYFGIIRWTSLDLPWRGKTSSYVFQQEVVKLELQFILPENIWTAGGQRGSQGKWSSWWTRYKTHAWWHTVCLCAIMLTYFCPNRNQRKRSVFYSICTCGSAHHKLHVIRFRYSPFSLLPSSPACNLCCPGGISS